MAEKVSNIHTVDNKKKQKKTDEYFSMYVQNVKLQTTSRIVISRNFQRLTFYDSQEITQKGHNFTSKKCPKIVLSRKIRPLSSRNFHISTSC